jgi:hypothetical protein
MNKKTYLLAVLFSFILSINNSHAASITDTNLLDVDTTSLTDGYSAFVKDAGVGLHFNPGNSGAPLAGGILPFGIKVSGELGLVGMSAGSKTLVTAAVGSDIPFLPVPKVKFQVGIPFGIDFGYQMVSVGGTITSAGYEVRYDASSFIPIPILDLAVRYHTESGQFTENLEVASSGFDVTVGANLPIIKPYANIGTLKITGTPSASFKDSVVGQAAGIDTVTHDLNITTIGAKFTAIPFMSMYGEYSTYGESGSSLISIGLGLDF